MPGGAKRYDPPRQTPSARISPASRKHRPLFGGLLLYVMTLPLLPAALKEMMSGMPGSTFRALSYAAAFALSMVAATMIRRGIGIAREALRRKIVRRASTIPYKFTGAVILSVAMFIVAMGGGRYGLLDSLLFALTTFIGCYLYYGFDPARKRGDVPAIGITSEEVIALLDEGESQIEAIQSARASIRNLEFRDRLQRITDGAQGILDTIEEDPRDARAARKFLKVYLDGARQVTEGYARTHKTDDSPALEDNFRRVLTTIEQVIAEQQQKLRENNLSELDVQIEVLQMQLEKEGVT